MFSRLPLAACLGVLLLAGAMPLHAQPIIEPDVRIRIAYVGVEGPQRDGSRRSDHDLLSRIQAGAGVVALPSLRFDARVAARLATNQEGLTVRGPGYAPGAEGLRTGDIALDVLSVTWQPVESLWLRAGRFQTSFVMPDVMQRGLIRNDSPNLSPLASS